MILSLTHDLSQLIKTIENETIRIDQKNRILIAIAVTLINSDYGGIMAISNETFQKAFNYDIFYERDPVTENVTVRAIERSK